MQKKDKNKEKQKWKKCELSSYTYPNDFVSRIKYKVAWLHSPGREQRCQNAPQMEIIQTRTNAYQTGGDVEEIFIAHPATDAL